MSLSAPACSSTAFRNSADCSRRFLSAARVDSAVLKILIYDKPALISTILTASSTVRAGFALRKQLPNSLAQGLKCSKEEALSLLAEAQIDPKRRAETLSLEEWGRLWKIYGSSSHADGSGARQD